jgi:hypothetical protein
MDWRIGLLHFATARQQRDNLCLVMPLIQVMAKMERLRKAETHWTNATPMRFTALCSVSTSTGFRLSVSNTSPVQDVKGKDKSKLL